MRQAILGILKEVCKCFKRKAKCRPFPGMAQIERQNLIDGTVSMFD